MRRSFTMCIQARESCARICASAGCGARRSSGRRAVSDRVRDRSRGSRRRRRNLRGGGEMAEDVCGACGDVPVSLRKPSRPYQTCRGGDGVQYSPHLLFSRRRSVVSNSNLTWATCMAKWRAARRPISRWSLGSRGHSSVSCRIEGEWTFGRDRRAVNNFAILPLVQEKFRLNVSLCRGKDRRM